ncbi:hypothetical protein L7F22_039835 [Adiantum nelumboides]|nr:hypothetical protein [Adiantum nelumboides]
MLTNVFRLGFRQISWFQLISADGENASLSEKWSEDHLTNRVLVAHTLLQNEGYFSAWTSGDFAGTNGGSLIKLWLFLPGRGEIISTALQSLLVGLKVVASGLWIVSNKDCNEVTNALCQALQNRMERGLRTVGYMRFGDVFVKCKAFGSSEPQLRRPLPACEVTFTASEEAIFVHFALKRKRVRSFSADDIQTALKLQHDGYGERNTQSVIVAPHGLSGKFVGCYSSDVIQMLHESKDKGEIDQLERSFQGASSNDHGLSSASGFHAEVSFTFETSSRLLKGNSLHGAQDMGRSFQEKEEKISTKSSCEVQKILLYPPEAVIVPLVPAVPAKVFLKRCWLQKCVGISWLEDELHAGPKLRLNQKSLHANLKAPHGVRSPSSKSSSSSSSSSGASSVEDSSSHGSSTSDSDGEAGVPPGELEADAESLVLKGKQMHGSSRSHLDVEMKGFEDVSALVKWGQSGGPAQGDASALKGMKRSSSSGGEISNEGYRSLQNRSDVGVQGMVLSPNVGLGTPKAASSQAGTPWNCWPEDDRALNVGIENDADILAEFGDFGDFFEDDGLGFGEPPGTAESQAMMFPLTDCLDGMGSSGNGCLEYTDPMLLPILDIPVLEGLDPDPTLVKEVKAVGCISGSQELPESLKSPDLASNSQMSMLNTLPKEEAVLLLAPGYEPVSLPIGREIPHQTAFKSPYVPGSRKAQLDVARGSECYVYGATPPPSPMLQVQERKREHYEMVSDRAVLNGKRLKNAGMQPKLLKEKPHSSLPDMVEKVPIEKFSLFGKKEPMKDSSWMELGANQVVARRFSTILLATEINCILLHLTAIQMRDAHLVNNAGLVQLASGNTKELPLNLLVPTDSSPFAVKVGVGNQQEKKKKDRIPSRIAGDMDEEVHDGPRMSQVGVWRPVGTPKPSRAANSSFNENTQTGSAVTSLDTGVGVGFETSPSFTKANHWQELLETLPLLIQQGSVLFDVSLDGDCGEGPLGWLSSQEQERLKSLYVCGPGGIHAGCGGTLCASHFLDNAGVELLDPLTSEISARSVATILQSDMRIAMATAFGDSLLDGPLSLGEWLKGRAFVNDTYGADSVLSDSKEIASTVLAGIGEPITPPQCTTGPAGLKAATHDIESQPCDTHRSSSSWAMEGSSLSDDGCTRRCGQETGSIETDAQLNNGRGGPTVMALPMPSLLIGYQDDWLKISSSTLHLWEKAPLEPYATTKPVIYYVLCPKIDSLLSATAEYIQQLSCVYEACMLGSHVAGNMMFGQTNLLPTVGKSSFSGFLAMDYPLQTSQQQGHLESACALNDFVTNSGSLWNPHEFLKALSKACRSLPVSASNTAQREHENGPCLAYYVICPSSDPNTILQTMLVACQRIGHNIAVYDKQRKTSVSNRNTLGSSFIDDSAGASQGLIGFSTSKLVLQVLTAESILKPSSPVSVDVDSLKEVAFGVYNKIRRIPRPYSSNDFIVHGAQPSRGRTLPFQSSSAVSSVLWKDCGLVRNTVTGAALPGHESLIDSSSFRSSNWESSSWQQQGVSNEASMLNHGHQSHDSFKYLFEPLFILAEPGTLDCGVGVSASRFSGLDDASGNVLVGVTEAMHGTIADSSADYDVTSGGDQKPANFHCSYGWTEDWQWLVSVWTDARGELLDVHLFPAGSSGRWDSKTLHNLFVQVLIHGCQLLLMANGLGSKPRALVITRIGAFFELECQEWQKAVLTVGGAEVRKWPVQIWQQQSDNNAVTGSSGSLHAQDVSTLAERAMSLGGGMPSSPAPSSLFLSRNKPANFVKTEMGGSSIRKQAGSGIGHGQADACRGAFHLVHSISFVYCMLDHTLQIVGLHDVGSQSNSVSSNWLTSSSTSVLTALGTGVGLIKTLATATASYMFVPAHGLRFLSSTAFQLPVCKGSEVAVPEQVVRKTGVAGTIASAFVVSKAVPSIRTELNKSAEEWPSTLFVGLVGHMSSFVGPSPQAVGQSASVGNDALLKGKHPKPVASDGGSDNNLEAHLVVEAVAAELQALSWLSVSPSLPFRRSALPFHCDITQRLRRLLQYAVNESSGLHDL